MNEIKHYDTDQRQWIIDVNNDYVNRLISSFSFKLIDMKFNDATIYTLPYSQPKKTSKYLLLNIH